MNKQASDNKKGEVICIELARTEISRADFLLKRFLFSLTKFFVRVVNA